VLVGVKLAPLGKWFGAAAAVAKAPIEGQAVARRRGLYGADPEPPSRGRIGDNLFADRRHVREP
jgi:hypothetical protein